MGKHGTKNFRQTTQTIHWLVLWVERNKDGKFSKMDFIKPETPHFHRCIRRDNVHRGVPARWKDVRTNLCNREMSCGTHQTYDNTEVRTPSSSFRSSSQKADNQWTWCQNWQNRSLEQLINSATVATSSAQEKQVFVASRAGELLENSSYRNPRNVHRRPKGVIAAKRAGMATTERR